MREGTRLPYSQISSVFASLSGEGEQVLPERFLHLKRLVTVPYFALKLVVQLVSIRPTDCVLFRSIIGDEANQRRLTAAWSSLTEHLAQLAQKHETERQKVSTRTIDVLSCICKSIS